MINYKSLIPILLLLPLFAFSQVTMRAKIDSSSILIGEQTHIHLELSQDKGKTVQLPVFDKTIIPGIELLQIAKPDTTELDDRRIRIDLTYLVTSYDSGLYYIPPFKAALDKDTFASNSVGLKVLTFSVDTVKKQFFPIKKILTPDIVWSDYYFIAMSILLLLFFITWGIYAYLRHKNNRPLFVRSEPALPPHIKAMSELDHIKQEKLWQQGREKDYHTRLTDVLRIYLHDRFGLNALEMTSAEILDVLRSIPEATVVYHQMKDVMELSDFVKFAKFHPAAEENEKSMMNALLFINTTKLEEVVPEEVEKTESKKES
ncbi:MAG: hypothetical protein PHV20_00400 [Bacteroidales bacterium]|nr:hypothetical protein [Bacteroidales bacterium]